MQKRIWFAVIAAIGIIAIVVAILLSGAGKKPDEAVQNGTTGDFSNAINAAMQMMSAIHLDENNSLVPQKETAFEGYNYYRLTQTYSDVPVYNGSVVVAIDEDGVAAFGGDFADVRDFNVSPVSSAGAVKDWTKSYIKDAYNCGEERFSLTEPELVIYSMDEREYCLAWKIDAVGVDENGELFNLTLLFSDADGSQLSVESNTWYDAVYRKSEGQNQGEQYIWVDLTDGKYTMSDEMFSIKANTYKNVSWIFDMPTEQWPKKWEGWPAYQWNEGQKPDPMMVDAIANVRKTCAYLSTELGFYFPEPILAAVQCDGTTDNSSYDDIGLNLVRFYLAKKDISRAGYLDTVAHELGHGVVRHKIHVGEGSQSKAVNEGYADIFGECVEDSLSNYNVDWIHRDRNIASPSKPNISKNSQFSDKLDCHYASTLISHIAYLMFTGLDAEGYPAKDTAISDTAVLAKLWFGSLLVMCDNPNFSDCRSAVELSAYCLVKKGVLTISQVAGLRAAFDSAEIYESIYSRYVLVDDSIKITVYDYDRILYDDYTVSVTNVENNIVRTFSPSEDGSTLLTFEQGCYVVLISDNSAPDSLGSFRDWTIFAGPQNRMMPGKKDALKIYTDFGKARLKILPTVFQCIGQPPEVVEQYAGKYKGYEYFDEWWYLDRFNFGDFSFLFDPGTGDGPPEPFGLCEVFAGTLSQIVYSSEKTVLISDLDTLFGGVGKGGYYGEGGDIDGYEIQYAYNGFTIGIHLGDGPEKQYYDLDTHVWVQKQLDSDEPDYNDLSESEISAIDDFLWAFRFCDYYDPHDRNFNESVNRDDLMANTAARLLYQTDKYLFQPEGTNFNNAVRKTDFEQTVFDYFGNNINPQRLNAIEQAPVGFDNGYYHWIGNGWTSGFEVETIAATRSNEIIIIECIEREYSGKFDRYGDTYKTMYMLVENTDSPFGYNLLSCLTEKETSEAIPTPAPVEVQDFLGIWFLSRFAVNGVWLSDNELRTRFGDSTYTFESEGKLTLTSRGVSVRGTYQVNGNIIVMNNASDGPLEWILDGDTMTCSHRLADTGEPVTVILTRESTLTPTDTITPEQVTSITIAGKTVPVDVTWLDLSDKDISDIAPLESLTSLTTLLLGDNLISDLTPLKSLTNLTGLSLSGNQVSNLSPLKTLTNLTWLNLSGNLIVDPSPLESLTDLKRLYLSNNQISDIASLKSLKNLAWLTLSNNPLSQQQISDIRAALPPPFCQIVCS